MNKMKKDMDEGLKPDSNAWMVTFSDLVMLLLTFFVLLLTMSSMDSKKLKSMFTHFRGATGVLEFVGTMEISGLPSLVQGYNTLDSVLVIDHNKLKDLFVPSEGLGKNMEKKIKEFDKLIGIEDDERGIIMSFQEEIFFSPGGVTLKKEVFPFLNSIADTIEACPNDILIMGHTDNIPFQSTLYESNWELSLYRGLSVLSFFLEEKGLSPLRFSVGGYGPSRPLKPNDTPKNRVANRRVEIIFRQLNS
ncbi:MAG: flagellar motor protein MotB [Thermodesulfobacteriota bacterium]|nr:flagellar motor protein MotB [Thermodesulfobacteriota bacterium]